MNSKNSIVVILICIIILFVGCKKWPKDYRNKYIGDYSFNWTKSSWDGNVNSWVTGIFQANGKIYYRPFQNLGRTITIEISGGPTFEPKVDRNGVLKQDDHETITGSISDNDIFFYASITNGGKGPGINYTIIGIKK